MAVIWQSSAFWLMICTVLLVLVGCTVLRNRIPVTETQSPHNTTLTPILASTNSPPDILQLIETETPIGLTPQDFFQRSTSPPPDRSILIDSPNCYELANGDYDCLGKIWNFTEDTIGNTVFELNLFDDTGTNLTSQIASAEQSITQSGEFAPYRTIIKTGDWQTQDNTPDISARLIDSYLPGPDIQQLHVTEASGTFTDSGLYHLSVTIRNDLAYATRDIRIFTTLDNTEWGIVGYDVYEVAHLLQTGEEHTLELDVIPLILTDQVEYFLHVEATIDP